MNQGAVVPLLADISNDECFAAQMRDLGATGIPSIAIDHAGRLDILRMASAVLKSRGRNCCVLWVRPRSSMGLAAKTIHRIETVKAVLTS